MEFTDVYIDGLGVRLGESVALAPFVDEGRYAADEYTANGLTHAAIAGDGEFAPDMAAEAVATAMARGAADPDTVRLLLYAGLYFQGQDMWTPASYIQQATIGGTAPSIEVDQKSAGGMASLSLGAAFLAACDDASAVLLATGDRYCEPGWDRFRTESGSVMGDGGTAAVLTRRPGFARVVSASMLADPTLEQMYRGDGLRTQAAPTDRPLNLRARKQKYMRRHLRELEEISGRIAGGVTACITDALAEAKAEVDDVAFVVMPNIGLTVRWWDLLAEMGIGRERTTWEWGRTIGHLGAGDQMGGLHHLLATGRLAPGDRVVLAGSGHGFNWGAAVVEILDIPAWATQAART